MVDKSILCGVPSDDPGKAVERRVIGVQIPVGPKSKQSFTVVEMQARGAARQILEGKIRVDVGR